MKRIIPLFDEQREMMLRLIPFERTTPLRVLDLGCGPGLFAARLLAEYPRVDLTAFDLTKEMLQSCRSRLAGCEGVTYRLGDFRVDALGNDYDLIVASLSLHHLELKERADFFRRAYSSLKEGGAFIAAEVIVDESPTVRQEQYQLWREFMAGHGEDGMEWYRRHRRKDHPETISSLLMKLSGAGFQAAGCFWRYLNFAIIRARKLTP